MLLNGSVMEPERGLRGSLLSPMVAAVAGTFSGGNDRDRCRVVL